METEDIIELGSSDEEPGPPPPKKMNVRNAMVHIPTKFHGVTIKPVKSTPELPKLGKNITITKTKSSPSSTITSKVKPPDKPLQKLAVAKKKAVAKKLNQTVQTKGKVLNPPSQAKKAGPVAVGSSTITKLKTPIVIKKPPINKPQPLQRLPPSITIKKTATKVVKLSPNIVMLPKTVSKLAPNNKKRKLEVLQTVELDDDEASTSSNNHPWYVRPEDQTTPHEYQATIQKEKSAISQENTNNTEPGPNYIEITIEDSPIKPAKTKRTRELSTEKVITIDDSPNKGGIVSEDVIGASDDESNTVKKVPHSKKKLKYATDLKSIEEIKIIEIEIEPIETIQPIVPNIEANEESQEISLSLEIIDEEKASVDITQNKQEDVSVVQNKPLQSKQNTKAAPKREVAIKSEFHPIYQSFISLCIQLENSNDMEKIIEKKIKTYYRQVPKEYTESNEFLDMVSSKITAMEAAPEKMYLFIKDIVDELNIQRKYLKEMPVEDKCKDQDSFLYGKENELDTNKQRQIRKLEKTLKKLNRAIQKLENQEVDFDDEEDSVYLLTEKYKERMVRVHAKFCQLTNTKMPSQPRLVIDPRPGLSAAPAKRLEAWINKKDGAVFPDFHDVLRCVREAVEQDNLGWNEAFIMEEARDLFVRCGRKLQRRRQENEWRIATSRIQPNSDPAEQSDELKKKLEANRRMASTKETEVFDKFCDRQSQLKLVAEEIDDKEAEESPVESEDEDNDEASSLESKQKRKDRLKRLLHEQSKKTIVSNKFPKTKKDIMENVEESVESVKDDKSETVNDEDKIESVSDDSNQIGSDMDELHLLQKLHSDNEICTGSTSDSDSETPISISDSLDSSSDNDKPTKKQLTDVISIENSSYSDESDSQKNNDLKKNKTFTVETKQLMEENKKIECTFASSEKNTNCNNDTLENIDNKTLSSSDDESNPDDNSNSGKSDNSSKVSSAKEGSTHDKDSVSSESAQLCINVNDSSKPSDADDEYSTNSDIILGSSVSSGQYEELLKEHNADPLLKAPELIPQDPSDKLFDRIVMKHYNDPLTKKTLKESLYDSPFPPNPENSNSDTQSTNAAIEEVKKHLIESSVDTEEFVNSPSNLIVDKLIDGLKRGSQSSDELSPSVDQEILTTVDQELGLRSDVECPFTFALQEQVNLARQTKSWPRFTDECSPYTSSENEAGDASQIVTTNSKEQTNNDSSGREASAKDTKALNNESKTCEAEEADIRDNNSTDANAFSTQPENAVASSSERSKNDESEANIVALSSQSRKDTQETINLPESGTTLTESKDSSKQAKEMTSEAPDDTNESLMEHEVLGELINSKLIPKENSNKTDNMDISDSNHETEHVADNDSEIVNNGNLNINMDISELLHSETNLSHKNDGVQKDVDFLDDLNEDLSSDKGDCDSENNIPRTITSVCLNRGESSN